MTELERIEELAKEYGNARQVLVERIESLQEEMAALKKRRLPGIKRAVAIVAESRQRLHNAIRENPQLFQRPKTITVHGLRCGYQKKKGELRWQSSDRVVQLIRKHLPDQVEILIKVTETPVKSALAQLSAAELKRIGVSVVQTADEIFIKVSGSDVEKFVDRLLAEDEKDYKRDVA